MINPDTFTIPGSSLNLDIRFQDGDEYRTLSLITTTGTTVAHLKQIMQEDITERKCPAPQQHVLHAAACTTCHG